MENRIFPQMNFIVSSFSGLKMFVYLSKKIALPGGVPVHSVAWNNDQGYLACGGDQGFLKVLKMENVIDPTKQGLRGVAAPTTLAMNQTLEGHTGKVTFLSWNFQHKKLTSADDTGMIVVWVLYKGVWFEEMVNNRQKSPVTSVHWNHDGQRIGILYEDGGIIVGSVEGGRIWGRDLKLKCRLLVWTPDSKFLFVFTNSGEIHVFDPQGTPMAKLKSIGGEVFNEKSKIVSADWYNGMFGYENQNGRHFAIISEHGDLLLLKDENDTAPITVDTGLFTGHLKWNHDGSILAVGGKNQSGELVINFYQPQGQLIRTLKVPGNTINGITWEHGGLRLSFAVDTFIYFANLRPNYKWCYLSSANSCNNAVLDGTICYHFTQTVPNEPNMIFFNTRTGEKYSKNILKLSALESSGDLCIMGCSASEEYGDQVVLNLCNAMGAILDSKILEFELKYLTMNKNTAICVAADCSLIYTWMFRGTSSAVATSGFARIANVMDGSKTKGKERWFHIDDLLQKGAEPSDTATYLDVRNNKATDDHIVAITSNDSSVLIARKSGKIYHYSLPRFDLECIYEQLESMNITIQNLYINCNSSKLIVVDITGVAKLLILETGMIKKSSFVLDLGPTAKPDVPLFVSQESGGKLTNFDRKDVWDVKWASDNQDLFALTEKTRMYIFRGLDPEEPINSSGYICDFNRLQVKSILLDELMVAPESPQTDLFIALDTKSLRDTRNILDQVGLADATRFVEDNPHPILWRLIAEASMIHLDFSTAQKAFVRCADYAALQFLKRIQLMNDKYKQRAEVLAYFNQFDLAEKNYMDIDRLDLAIDLRIRIGDWFRVKELLSGSQATMKDDILMERTLNSIGDYYMERQRWLQATSYYVQSRNVEKLAETYYLEENFVALEKLMVSLPDSHPLLPNLAEKFGSLGMCEAAVTSYLKTNDVKSAIDTCVFLNQWDKAIQLAEIHKFKEIESLLGTYAKHLLERNKRFNAAELYKKANQPERSAQLLFDLAEDAKKMGHPPLRIKKLFVLAALEVERFFVFRRAHNQGTNTLDSLLQDDKAVGSVLNPKYLDNPWRGAEAYHFYLLAQRQLYANKLKAAALTATHLHAYEDILGVKVVNSLIALTAYKQKNLETCSKALTRLEALSSQKTLSLDDDYEDSDEAQYERLALSIFSKAEPVNVPVTDDKISCPYCASSIASSYC